MPYHDIPIIAIGLEFTDCIYNDKYINWAKNELGPPDFVDNIKYPLIGTSNWKIFNHIKNMVDNNIYKYKQSPIIYNLFVSERGDYRLDESFSEQDNSQGHSIFKSLSVITRYLSSSSHW